MSGERMSLKDSISLFFGESEKAVPFFNALYRNTNYSSCPNTEKGTGLEGTEIFEMMLARNYNNKTGINDEDIHHEFIDFIVNTALLHKKFDEPKGIHPTLLKVKNSCLETASNHMNSNNKFEDYVNTVYDILRSMRTDAPQQPELIEFKLNNQSINNQLTNLANEWINILTSDSTTATNAQMLFDKAGTNISSVKETYKKNIQNNFVNTMKDLALEISRLLGWNNTSQIDNNPNQSLLFNLKQNQNLKNDLERNFCNGAFSALKAAIGTAGLIPYTTFNNNNNSHNFCQHILTNWRDLDPQARLFYRENIAIFQKLKSDQWGTNNLLSDDRFMEKLALGGIKACDEDSLRMNLLKAKSVKGDELVKFAHTLPFIPVEKLGNLWYTDNNGRINKVQKGSYNSDVLKQIYQQVYLDNKTVDLGRGVSINLSNQLPNDQLNGWSHNLTRVVKSIIGHTKNSDYQKPSGSLEELLDLDTNTVWHSDGEQLFRLEQNGKKVLYNEYFKNGYNCGNTLALNAKNPGDSAKCEQIANCILYNPENLASCLDKHSSSEMFKVAQKELRDKMDPFVAKKLLQVFHVGITKTNMIDRNRNNLEIIQPITFNQWMEHCVNNQNYLPKKWTQEFRDDLRKNTHLLNYVKGVIDFVRANPAILNPDRFTTEGVTEDETIRMLNNTDREKPYSIGEYRWPYEVEGSDALKYTVGLLANTSNSIFTPVPNTLRSGIAGVLVGDGIMVGGSGLNTMAGGAAISNDSLNERRTINELGIYLNSLLNDLHKSGLSFTPEDERKITDYCKKLVDTEKKIKQMVKALETLHNLQNFVRCYDNGKYAGYTSGKVISLEDIVSNKDLLLWLNSNIGDYENCIYRGMEYINAGSNQVLKAYNDLIQSASQNSKSKIYPLE